MSNLPLRSGPRQTRRRRNAVHENMPDFEAIHGMSSLRPAPPTPYKAKKRKSLEEGCPICLKDYTENEEIVYLHGPTGAKHTMCTDCFSRMGSTPNPDECPICRQKIFSVASSFGRCVYLQRVKPKRKKKTLSSFGNANRNKLFTFLRSAKSSQPTDSKKQEILNLYTSLGNPENIVDKDGNTIFFTTRNTELLQMFMRNTGDKLLKIINKQNNAGQTALMAKLSQRNPNFNLIRAMVLLGADPNLPGTNGVTPFQFVIRKYKQAKSAFIKNKMLEFLLEHSVSPVNFVDLALYAQQNGITKAAEVIKKDTPTQVIDMSSLSAALPTSASAKKKRDSLDDLIGAMAKTNVSPDPFFLDDLGAALPKVTQKKRSDPFNLGDLGTALPSSTPDPFNLGGLSDTLPNSPPVTRARAKRMREDPFSLKDLSDSLPSAPKSRKKKNTKISMSELKGALPTADPFDMGSLSSGLPETPKRKRGNTGAKLSNKGPKRGKGAFNLDTIYEALPSSGTYDMGNLDNALPVLPKKRKPRKPRNSRNSRNSVPLRRSARLINKNVSELGDLMTSLGMSYGRKRKSSDNKKRSKPKKTTKKKSKYGRKKKPSDNKKRSKPKKRS